MEKKTHSVVHFTPLMLQKQNIPQLTPNPGSWVFGSAVLLCIGFKFSAEETSNLILEISEQLQPT